MKKDLRKKGVAVNGLKVSKSFIRGGVDTLVQNFTEQNLNLFVNTEKPHIYNNFATINLDFLKWLITKKLTARKYKIFLYLLTKMNFNNRAVITNRELQDELKIDKGDLSRDLRDLIDKGVLLRSKVGARSYEIRLNYETRLNLDSIYINQQAVYKGKRTTQNIKDHKELIERNSPYYSQPDLFGGLSIVDKKTGEKIKSVREANHIYLNDAAIGDNKREVTKQITTADDFLKERIKDAELFRQIADEQDKKYRNIYKSLPPSERNKIRESFKDD